jgi:hypothetical protein
VGSTWAAPRNSPTRRGRRPANAAPKVQRSSIATGHPMRHRIIFGSLFLWFSMLGLARGDVLATEFLTGLNITEERARLMLHIQAVAMGIGWYNSVLEAKSQRLGLPDVRLYCPPNLGLTAEQHIDMVRRFVQKNPKEGSSPLPYVMIEVLMTTFPCRGR